MPSLLSRRVSFIHAHLVLFVDPLESSSYSVARWQLLASRDLGDAMTLEVDVDVLLPAQLVQRLAALLALAFP